MGPSGEMNDGVDGGEMLFPCRVRADFPDRAKLDTGNGHSRAARQPAHAVTALDQPAAQRAADKAGGPGNHDLRQPRPSAAAPARLRKRSCGKCSKEAALPKQGQPAQSGPAVIAAKAPLSGN